MRAANCYTAFTRSYTVYRRNADTWQSEQVLKSSCLSVCLSVVNCCFNALLCSINNVLASPALLPSTSQMQAYVVPLFLIY